VNLAWAPGRGRWPSSQLIDCVCLAGITITSALPYLPRLGFYSDDWGLLASFDFAAHHHRTLAASVVHDFAARPVQGLYFVSLFELFRLHPLGYHMANTAVLVGAISLFYLLLVRLHVGRVESLAASLLFLMLPQLSTVRVWYAAFQIPLSLLLMLASMHAQLSFSRTGKVVWLAPAIGAAILSVGAYEIFAPLLAGFAAVLLVFWWRSSPRDSRSRWWVALSSAAAVALIFATIAYKVFQSGRAGPIADPNRYVAGLRQLVRPDYDWRVDSGLNIFAMAQAYFWAPVKGWWTGVVTLLTGKSGVEVTLLGVAIAAVAFWRLIVTDGDGSRTPRPMLAIGIAAFILGHAVFLLVPYIAFTSTGIDNRTQVAAAIGVALIFTAFLSVISVRRNVLAALVALVTAAAFARLSMIEDYWAEAPELQKRILTPAQTDLVGLPAESTVILDGICPYHGPAIVFESWDAGGALTLTLHRAINADLVSSRMSLTQTGLSTSIYKMPDFYPYGDRLYVYQPYQHRLVRLDSAAAAKAYFTTRGATLCPVGYVARGVAV
jgi:hypothetical protein